MTIIYEPRECSFDGCNRKTRNKGSYRGKTRYDHLCEKHHRMRSDLGGENVYYWRKTEQSKCENCGWDKATCDRHRKIPSKGYTQDNITILCPNCHRLVTFGLLTL
jgi:hypothetical protein